MQEYSRFILTSGDFIVGDSIWVVGREKDNFPIIVVGEVSNISEYEHKTFSSHSEWKPIKQVRINIPVDTVHHVEAIYKKAHFKKAKENLKSLMREHKEMLAESVVALQMKCARFKEHKEVEKAKMSYITSSLKEFLNKDGILEEVSKFKEKYLKEKEDEEASNSKQD